MRKKKGSSNLVPFDPEPERTFHKRRATMADAIARLAELERQMAQRDQENAELRQQLADQQLQVGQPQGPATLGERMDPAQFLPRPGVVLPALTPVNFELKPALLNMIR